MRWRSRFPGIHFRPRSNQLLQAVQQRMLCADSFGGDAADPPAAGVVHAHRSIDGADAYRYAMLKANLSC